MSEDRLETIENRLKRLEKERQHFIDHLIELSLTVEKMQERIDSTQNLNQPSHVKVEYLTAANEQMFQQNQRLREYIEACINGEKTLDQKSYLKALSGE
ncbi:hypothetical protein H1D32_21440 [Anaerobacillus sp. CMMVII]|uniref:hypothetical protein n=1 Tax=Anaerobacillus sp. CMMVII TaxID=2755588 RepID=UPI0021B7A2A6|nr:hypothetical protein [Anaerobacillus sp. CMMVII]MCT8140023.1 hypothetical protein [Anaerobacillus sp. CMMVII]